jgi:hypothetical protein
MAISQISRISQISTSSLFILSAVSPYYLPEKINKIRESEDIEKFTDPTDLTEPPVAMAAAFFAVPSGLEHLLRPFPTSRL